MSDTPVRKVAADALTPGHPTAGVLREEAIVIGDLWSGRALTEPGVASEWHHHGEHDTIAYVVRGALRVETATDVVQGEPGDFVHVPAHTVHRESNPTTETSEVVVIRRGAGPVVVNVDGPAEPTSG
jgi:uncharacterized RmlC-like cupin family protein